MTRPHFILLDGSYFVFFRYHALRRWWQHARREDEPLQGLDCPRYLRTFNSTFAKRLASLPKMVGYKADNGPIIGIVARDCPSEECWRRAILPGYKGTREADPVAGSHFEIVARDNMFKSPVIQQELSYPGLEADDCIAITVGEIRRRHPDAMVTIVSSDGDFKQLLGPNVALVDLKGKTHGGPGREIDPERELFCRIVSGDASDNVPGVFARCGRKTAESLYDVPEKMYHRMASCPQAGGIYARNRLLIDFRCIPEPLSRGFVRTRLRVLD